MVVPARERAFRLLCCPVCRTDLSPAGPALACARGHSFDLARSGYANLMVGRNLRAAAGGDGSAQLRHRSAFLSASHFDFIGDAILRQTSAGGGAAQASRWHVLDAGCGTGYHLERITRHRLDGGTGRGYGLGLDRSKHAARLASRRLEHLAFAVTDLWIDWPVRSRSVDLVLSLFAPRNFAEMARVLRSDGLLAIAYPGARHLVELRRAFGLMGIKEGKARRYRQAAGRFLGDIRRTCLRRHVDLDPDEVLGAIGMGPNATRMLQGGVAPPGRRTVTFDVEILFARLPRPGRTG